MRVPQIASQLQISASIAVNGCCLTVVAHDDATFSADLAPETLRRTSFIDMKAGAHVNLERPLKAGDEFGGHFVQGHVDGVGRIVEFAAEEKAGDSREQNWRLEIELPAEIARYVAEKGSLAVDGISLTVAALQDSRASFAIIPFTYQRTNLRERAKGDLVNLEVDVLAKYIERLISARAVSA